MVPHLLLLHPVPSGISSCLFVCSLVALLVVIPSAASNLKCLFSTPIVSRPISVILGSIAAAPSSPPDGTYRCFAQNIFQIGHVLMLKLFIMLVLTVHLVQANDKEAGNEKEY
jgi:hypothetical protein